MKLSSTLHRPLDRLLREAIDGLTEPALLLDPELRVAHANEAAAPLFAGPTFRRDDHDGCLSPVLDGQPCTGESTCHGCQLYRDLQIGLAAGESFGPIFLERQLLVDGRLVTRAFEAEAHPYRLDGKTGLLVTLNEIAEDASERLAG